MTHRTFCDCCHAELTTRDQRAVFHHRIGTTPVQIRVAWETPIGFSLCRDCVLAMLAMGEMPNGGDTPDRGAEVARTARTLLAVKDVAVADRGTVVL